VLLLELEPVVPPVILLNLLDVLFIKLNLVEFDEVLDPELEAEFDDAVVIPPLGIAIIMFAMLFVYS
jgi:hypothetical protein